ncbi:Ribonuclease II OS=Tsukamurella paurometabola (strain ATCC 8368 / DSM / CCUG 35730 / CIP 100753/ JCM 10117 / KCTC 9821 / NBRC 16120 / NCIMB 702349 / NCTC 13040) OX=521096 GN=Tpau_1489 PE=4 SV=1 [Tsukamurella paurometabola]|uniref:Ribonuclease II n=1 Tax=Tsukamurella paurometabola (strain ATCC 8368 / DSM 20162 / CCUG 35730 / CIP 100753 / JCM 10117 / KCTC 9821 / NBRC 16120 / NCIMB 702349 / NCTC 13040) TaxID=521096 RepID=D5UXM2_TSUPD|nr:RNB domain-containing ribonuclease [Tsukamurella paurometabola]ADG78114.1 ribonuclease II [Tsukamurella paurometabola DSM 20162]SUP30245.1 Ribonuclease R [Tsukamurella paurometabola]
MRGTVPSSDVDFAAVRAEFELVEEFPAAAQSEAEEAVDRHAGDRQDRRDIEFVTIDPPGSKDLDQAVHIVADGDGYLVRYAIADVGALVPPGGALEDETRRRGQTMYLPDGSVPLHPRALSEGAGSLLPGEDRPVALWEIRVDAAGEVTSATVRRATVRSRAQLDYAGVQADFNAGRVHPSVALLPEVGRLRQAWSRAHGAIELRLPAQEAVRGADGWELRIEPRTDFDGYNAQISLLTGVCAAAIMLDAGAGLLRTLPAAPKDAVDDLRRTAAALGQSWPEGASVGDFLAGVDVSTPRGLAVMSDAARLLRGSGYAAFGVQGAVALPADASHAGVGAPYAHVTAPLRRLADRYATEVCLAACAEAAIPEWASAALIGVAETMQRTNTVANKVDRACIDLTEAVILGGRVGEIFEAVALREDQVLLDDPAVIAPCTGAPPEGARVRVRLESADVATRKVGFRFEGTLV